MRSLAVLIAAVALLMVPAAAQAASVAPVLVTSSNNPGCDDIPNADPDWVEYKPHDSTPVGTYGPDTDGTLEVEFTVNPAAAAPNDFQTVDWSSNIGVDAVIIKATNAGNAYVYDPPGPESTGDTGLVAPLAGGNKPADVSHVTFCYDANDPPPPDPVIPEDPDPEPNLTSDPPPPPPPAPEPLIAAAPAIAAAPTQQVAAQRSLPGSARLSAPARCVRGLYTLRVRGAQIRSVTFYVGNRKVRTVRGAQSQRTFSVSLRARGGPVQRVRARVRFTVASGTAARTLRAAVVRCARQVSQPRFTG